jgi:hypothetical protein
MIVFVPNANAYELAVQLDVYRPGILERLSFHCSIVMAMVGITSTDEYVRNCAFGTVERR